MNLPKQQHINPDDNGAKVVVTLINVRGSAPRDPGAKLEVFNAGNIGTIGGGHLEYDALHKARDLLKRQQASNKSQSPWSFVFQ